MCSFVMSSSPWSQLATQQVHQLEQADQYQKEMKMMSDNVQMSYNCAHCYSSNQTLFLHKLRKVAEEKGLVARDYYSRWWRLEAIPSDSITLIEQLCGLSFLNCKVASVITQKIA